MLLRVLALFFLLAALARADAPQPPPIAARAWLLVDLAGGQPIAAHNADERIEPASLTKLMTAYLVFDRDNFNCLFIFQTKLISELMGKKRGKVNPERTRQRFRREFKLEAVRLLDVSSNTADSTGGCNTLDSL